MYVLVRADLTPGQQLAQAIHAAVELRAQRPVPETVVVLSVQDEQQLLSYAAPGAVVFHEPDLGGVATALAAVSVGTEFSALPLAGAAMVT